MTTETIKLKELNLRYFKGVKELSIKFDDNTTNIYGDNAAGKTTIFDAFTWLLFGKDSQGFSDSNFSIKTLDEKGIVIPKVEHEVSAVLNISGYTMKLKRILREKWETKRGTSIPVFTGNETACEFDDIPVSVTEYNKRIAGLIDENLFKLITNPLYFNSLNWKDRRKVLIGLAGEITDESIASENPEFQALLTELNGKTMEDLKIKTVQQKKAIKQELDQIPTRIDEVRKGMPEAENYDEIIKKISTFNNQISDIDKMISDRSSAIQSVFDEIQKKHAEINKLKKQQSELLFSERQKEVERVQNANLERGRKESELRKVQSDLESLKRDLSRSENDFYLNNQINEIEQKITQLRNQFKETNESEYKASSEHLICPLYKHACNDSVAISKFLSRDAEAEEVFNREKINRLNSINNEGSALSERRTELLKKSEEKKESESALRIKIEEQEKLIEALQNEISQISIEKEIVAETLPGWKEIDGQIMSIEASIREPEKIDNSELSAQRTELTREVYNLQSRLHGKQIIENSEKRIVELNAEQSKLAQQLADLDKIEFNILEFTKAKMNEIDKRVNCMFEQVRFKLFDTQINGGEVECCETLINTNGSWVPYTAGGNNAGKINAGIDIINTLCRANGITAPIFVDNRESINELIYTQSQVINLIVSKDKKLTVKQ